MNRKIEKLVTVRFQFNLTAKYYVVAVAAPESDWLADNSESGINFHVSQTYN